MVKSIDIAKHVGRQEQKIIQKGKIKQVVNIQKKNSRRS
jgi:hypothetical protein